MDKSCRHSNDRVYIEGNHGGDYLQMVPLEDNLVHIEIANCCVVILHAIVPIEFITGLITETVLEHGSIENAIHSLSWPGDYLDELAEQVTKLDSFCERVQEEDS